MKTSTQSITREGEKDSENEYTIYKHTGREGKRKAEREGERAGASRDRVKRTN